MQKKNGPVVINGNMHKISFNVANVIPLLFISCMWIFISFFVCSRIYVRCILESFYFCRFMSVVSHFRYFQPYTRCNKFSGETLNINLLLCPFFSLHLALVCEHQTRMLAVPWMTCGTFWEKLIHKKPNIVRFFTRVHVVQANGLTYINEQQELVRGRTERCDMHFSI